MIHVTIPEAFLASCEKYPAKTAIVDDTGSITFGDLRRKARLLAGLVRSWTKRQNVGICLPTCKEFGVVYFGALMAGKTAVPLNYLLQRSELDFITRDSELDTIITVRYFSHLVGGLAQNTIYLEDLRSTWFKVRLAARKIVAGLLGASKLPALNPDDVATLLYTSGTTTTPKGVMLTHDNFMSNLDGCMKACFFDDRDIIFGALPLFHSFALSTALILPARLGVLAVYMRRFQAGAALGLITQHRVTAVLAIPSMYRVLVRSMDKDKYDTRSLRLCVAGGEACPQELSVAFRKAFDRPLLEGYGLTETAPVLSVNSPERYKLGTAGPPLPNVEIRIADEQGNPLPPGAEGEIWARGPNIMKGYYKRPDLTREAMTPDGWFKTGDLGRLDADGFLAITGRKKELIISSGENISPNEIEAVLMQHPKVFEAAVLPAADKMRGEVPKAYIALHPGQQATEQEIKDFCEGRLAKHKIPRYVEFREQLPHGPTGKVLKRAIHSTAETQRTQRTT